MDKEKEKQEIINILKSYFSEEAQANALLNVGYGNAKQAVKEFAEKVKEELTNLVAGKNEEVLCKIEVCMELENRIDNLITELYGE